ncbi:MAG TPA: hypothetical protein VF797_04215, partial [Noviherbaspirillum sp.]
MLLALPFAALESNRPCSDIFPIHGWVQKYWTTLVEIELTDVNFPNFPAADGTSGNSRHSACLDMSFVWKLRLTFACQSGKAMPAFALAGAAKATRQVKGLCRPNRRMASGQAGMGMRHLPVLIAIVLP